MNIAEIRKKSKKKKTNALATDKSAEKQILKEETENLPVATNQQLPDVPAPLDIVPENEEEIFEDFIDEESFYIKQSEKESRCLTELFCFFLGSEEYGIDISIAKEVIKIKEITEVPKVPDVILGIISVRGAVVPIFDIKNILGIQNEGILPSSKFVLLNIENEIVGILIDKITQITKVCLPEIGETPINVNGAKHEFIKGVAVVGEKTIRVLNIQKIFDF